MTRELPHRAPSLRRAVALAPLAAPIAIAVGSAIRSLISRSTAPSGVSLVAGVVFGLALLLLYGAPLAYGCTILIVWPMAAASRGTTFYRWWTMMLVSGIAGAIAFPAYLHTLDSRGTWDFFPGAGFAAGAATGYAFWYIAARR